MASAIVKMVPQVQEGGTISLFQSSHSDYKDGEQQRDFIYVKDVAAITCDVVESSLCGIYNVGTGQAATWNRLACAVFEALGKKPCIEYIPLPSDLKGKYQNYTQANVGKIEQALGKKVAQDSLEQAVSDYIVTHLIKDTIW